MIDLANPKVRKAAGWFVAAVVLLGLTGVLAGPEIVGILTPLAAAVFGG